MPFYLLPGGRPGRFFHIPQQNITTRHQHRQFEGAGKMQDRRQGPHRRDPQPLRRIRYLPYNRRQDALDLEMEYRQLPESDN